MNDHAQKELSHRLESAIEFLDDMITWCSEAKRIRGKRDAFVDVLTHLETIKSLGELQSYCDNKVSEVDEIIQSFWNLSSDNAAYQTGLRQGYCIAWQYAQDVA